MTRLAFFLAALLAVVQAAPGAVAGERFDRVVNWEGVDGRVEPLITPHRLSEIMASAPVQIVDIRHPTARRALYSYAAGHVPGSINVPFSNWRAVWSDPKRVPSSDDLTKLIRSTGLYPQYPVVIVHSSAAKGNFGSAAWTYWVLKSAGFRRLAILDGGVRGWEAAGFALSKRPTPVRPNTVSVQLNTHWLATHEDVTAVLEGRSDAQLLDARPLHQIGDLATLAGSATLASDTLMHGPDGQAGDILPIFESLKQAAGVNWQTQAVIAYCNNGLLAAVDWFMASEVAEIPNVKIYGHSLSARDRAGIAVSNAAQTVAEFMPILDFD